MAQEGFEPSASLILSESGLPVAYRAASCRDVMLHQVDRGRADCPGWDSNPQAPGFKPGRSADWRTWAFASSGRRGPPACDAEAVGLEPTSGLRRHLFSRQAP